MKPPRTELPQHPPREEDSRTVRALLGMGKALANLVALTLRHARYETREATSEKEFRSGLAEWRPDLVLIDVDHFERFLDLVHPPDGEMGPSVLAFTRRRSAAVKLRTFERGADDIIEGPFTLDEILARPYALMRRMRGIVRPLTPKLFIDGLRVDLLEQTVTTSDGRRLQLTPTQQALLYILAASSGETLSRETLLANIWGADLEIESNVIDRHVRELRVKLGDDWRSPRYIETVAGKGYRFNSTPHAEAPTAEQPSPHVP